MEHEKHSYDDDALVNLIAEGNLTYAGIAKELGISESLVKKIARGQRRPELQRRIWDAESGVLSEVRRVAGRYARDLILAQIHLGLTGTGDQARRAREFVLKFVTTGRPKRKDLPSGKVVQDPLEWVLNNPPGERELPAVPGLNAPERTIRAQVRPAVENTPTAREPAWRQEAKEAPAMPSDPVDCGGRARSEAQGADTALAGQAPRHTEKSEPPQAVGQTQTSKVSNARPTAAGPAPCAAKAAAPPLVTLGALPPQSIGSPAPAAGPVPREGPAGARAVHRP